MQGGVTGSRPPREHAVLRILKGRPRPSIYVDLEGERASERASEREGLSLSADGSLMNAHTARSGRSLEEETAYVESLITDEEDKQ